MNLGAGRAVVGEVNLITQFCFAMGIRGLARRLLGNKAHYRIVKEKVGR